VPVAGLFVVLPKRPAVGAVVPVSGPTLKIQSCFSGDSARNARCLFIAQGS